ncbi:centrosomal protein of 162 kDa [Bombina bombina]|uniref:centrosomal protein of 162 kDa n=1 Tax=Bombina bombina TaxID=8345 RepID=UPI00235A4E38|nr:centrosomal protein of 162 kDa [Bombina bombina]
MAHWKSKEELDEEFEQFLKESISDDSFESSNKPTILDNLGRQKNKKPLKKDFAPRWTMDEDSDDGDVIGTRSSFLKSQRSSQPIEEEDEEESIKETQIPNKELVSVSVERDSLEIDESVVASGPNQTIHGMGLDTLEEQEEKERFFAKLENGASSTIDYSKLNKDLDATDSTVLTALICKKENLIRDEYKLEKKDLSGNYSEDFEDDAISPPSKNDVIENKEPEEEPLLINQGEEKTGMLAKVMLLDSVDSTLDTQKLHDQVDAETETCTTQGSNDAMGTGASYVYTNSDIEALHLAYRHLDQSMEDTNEQKNSLNAKSFLADTPNSNGKSLKQMSTVESDLPTVEELMQPIRAVSDQDSELQSMSLIKQTHHRMPHCSWQGPTDKADQSFVLEKQHSDYLYDWTVEKEEELKMLRTSHTEPGYERKTEPTDYRHHLNKEMYESSEEELHPNDSLWKQAPKSPHQHHKNVIDTIHNKELRKRDKSPKSVLKKTQTQHYSHVRSSGYGKVATPLKQPVDSENLKPFYLEKKGKSPPDGKSKGVLSATRTIRFTENRPTNPQNKADSSAQLYKASSLQKEFGKHETNIHQKGNIPTSANGVLLENSSSTHISDTNLMVLQRLQNVEDMITSKNVQSDWFKVELSKKDEEMSQRIEEIKTIYERELHQLKQENYMLQTKIHTSEEKHKKHLHLAGDLKGPVTDETMQQIQKEIEEQETILRGYQQENERLYQQVKELQLKNKQDEDRMFQENLSLKAEIASLRERQQKPIMHLQHSVHEAEDSKKQTYDEMTAEIRALQKKEKSFLDEINRYKQDKQALEIDLIQMRKERDLAKAQLTHHSGEKSYEMKIMEETYKQEISQLNKRLQWFAENQELLDKDAKRLRDAYDQIESLKTQFEKLKNEAGNQSAQQQKRLKEKSSEAKRIQDLERQVKEMEGILKRRHPNSIPALIYAAATVPETDAKSSAKGNTVAFLERRINKLETDLENKDEEAKRSLRTMEQQFQKIKIQYESRINELEGMLVQKLLNEPPRQIDNTTKVKALEQELSICKEAYQTTIMNLQKDIDTLKEKNRFLENERMKLDNFTSINTQVDETSAKAKLAKLNQDFISKCKEVQELTKTVERLQRERMMMLSDKNLAVKVDPISKNSNKMKKDHVPPEKRSTEVFPGTFDEKIYQPGTFADFHISDIQQENERLKEEVQRLSLEFSEQRTKFQASLSRTELTIQRLKEEATEQTAALKSSHRREIEKIICQHAVEHSASRVAELSSTVSTQEILIKHLQQQVSELQKDKDSLAVLRIREETLQKEITKLLNELKEAKDCHSPEMKHFSALEYKIKNMELRHSQREQELQQIIQQTQHVAEAEQVKQVDKWKNLAQQKNLELEKFRTELDTILDVLRVLQRQGVVIPAT